MSGREDPIYRSEDWQLPWLLERTRQTPHAPALVFEEQILDYAELAARVHAVVHALSRCGVEAGDVVALQLPNGLPLVELVHAGFAGNFIIQLVNTRLTPHEVEFQLRDSGARYFVHLVADEAAEAVELGEGVQRLRVPDRRSARRIEPGTQHMDDRAVVVEPSFDPEAPRFILYTSGTSGKPKGVALHAANLLASANGSAALLGARASDRWLLCLPIFHVGGLSILLRSVLAGSTVFLHEGFAPEAVNRALDREGITAVSLVAAMLTRVLEVRTVPAAAPSLRFVLLGGGPVPTPLQHAACRADFPIAPTYGLTEAASQVATRPPGNDVEGGLCPLPGTELMIVDESGSALGPEETGEIFVRSGAVMRGYWQSPDATREALRDGWLHTGDIGSLDREGRLHVFDRRSDLIVSGGENIYPAEVESVLLEHPALLEAGVAGEADELYGQHPVAWLVSKQEAPPDEDSIRAHCRARLAGYKCPVKFYFVSALPRTATGKLLRRQLGNGGSSQP